MFLLYGLSTSSKLLAVRPHLKSPIVRRRDQPPTIWCPVHAHDSPFMPFQRFKQPEVPRAPDLRGGKRGGGCVCVREKAELCEACCNCELRLRNGYDREAQKSAKHCQQESKSPFLRTSVLFRSPEGISYRQSAHTQPPILPWLFRRRTPWPRTLRPAARTYARG